VRRGERKKGWGAEERRSGGAEELLAQWNKVRELRKKRELIIFGYLARKSHPKFRLPGEEIERTKKTKKINYSTFHLDWLN